MAVLRMTGGGSVGEEVADRLRDLISVCLQREVARVEEANDRTGNVVLERLGPCRQEERIVLAPYGKKRRLVCAEVVLERRVEHDVVFIVAEQIELNFIRT